MGCSVVGAAVGGEAGVGCWCEGTLGAGPSSAAVVEVTSGETGVALAGDDCGALAGAVAAAESGGGFVTDGALVIGGGLGTGGFVTEAAFWIGLGF